MDNIQLCSLDGNQLKDKKSLYRHNKLHFREGEHICSICKKVFTQKAYLLKHVKQLHSAPSYVCMQQLQWYVSKQPQSKKTCWISSK